MSTRISRRQVLATIALADAPAPKAIRFRNDRIDIDLEHVADVRSWGAVFGADPERVERAVSAPMRFTNSANNRPMVSAMVHATWQGWEISLDATEYADDVEPLDDATREQLRAIAAETAAAHYQVAGWGGVPGECGVECACGTTFDHFGTIAEAAALLDDHIAAAAKAGAPC